MCNKVSLLRLYRALDLVHKALKIGPSPTPLWTHQCKFSIASTQPNGLTIGTSNPGKVVKRVLLLCDSGTIYRNNTTFHRATLLQTINSELSVCKELLVMKLKVTETLVHTFVHVKYTLLWCKDLFMCKDYHHHHHQADVKKSVMQKRSPFC